MKKVIIVSSLILFLLIVNGCQNSSSDKISQVEETTIVLEKKEDNSKRLTREVFDEKYAHVVYFWFKNPENKEGRALFEKSLRTFLDNSQFAKTHFIGIPPESSRQVVNDSFTYNLILSFASVNYQEAYQDEAAHKTLIEESSHLWEKVLVYDANTIDQ